MLLSANKMKYKNLISFLVAPNVGYTVWNYEEGLFRPSFTNIIDRDPNTSGIDVEALFSAISSEVKSAESSWAAILVKNVTRSNDDQKTVRQMTENDTVVTTILKILGIDIIKIEKPSLWQKFSGVYDATGEAKDYKKNAKIVAAKLFPNFALPDWSYQKSESLLIGYYAVEKLMD